MFFVKFVILGYCGCFLIFFSLVNFMVSITLKTVCANMKLYAWMCNMHGCLHLYLHNYTPPPPMHAKLLAHTYKAGLHVYMSYEIFEQF